MKSFELKLKDSQNQKDQLKQEYDEKLKILYLSVAKQQKGQKQV